MNAVYMDRKRQMDFCLESRHRSTSQEQMENPNLNACNFPQIGTIPTQKTLFIFLKTN